MLGKIFCVANAVKVFDFNSKIILRKIQTCVNFELSNEVRYKFCSP